mgnify:CR=1 FL=1
MSKARNPIMSMLDIHRLYCQRFLNQLEEIQQNLPKIQQDESAYELELLFDSFNRECQQNLTRLIKQKEDEEQFQLFKQLEIICNHIHQLTPPLTKMKKNDLTSEQVNNYFDDQERFIDIVQNHLHDLNNFLYSSPN